jgi:hypothetical protein
MFQATRPSLAWSSVEIRRAKLNGCSCRIDAVNAMPRCSVAYAMALASTDGSLLGTWRPTSTYLRSSPR